MKNVFYVTLLSAFVSFSVSAQTSNKEAKALLMEASDKLNSFDQIYLGFTYTFENNKVDPPITQSETGNIAIKKDDFHLNFLGTKQIKIGKTLYTILEEDEEVQITDYEESETDGISPSSILSSYQKGYSYKIEKTVTENGKKVVYLKLKPTVSEEVKEITVVIEKESLKVKLLKQVGTNGTITSFAIDEYTPNKKLAAGYFGFKKSDYPDYYISE